MAFWNIEICGAHEGEEGVILASASGVEADHAANAIEQALQKMARGESTEFLARLEARAVAYKAERFETHQEAMAFPPKHPERYQLVHRASNRAVR